MGNVLREICAQHCKNGHSFLEHLPLFGPIVNYKNFNNYLFTLIFNKLLVAVLLTQL